MVILKSVFLLIIFSNHIFAKDFDDLFKITIEIKNENIENSIDRAFNDLVFRLIGYEDLEKAKIIKGNFDSKDFLSRYAVVRNNDSNFLQASFEEDIVMSQFIENGINFIGRNRPIIFLDIQIDNGFDKPFKIESIPYETRLESSIKRIFDDISKKRGLFFEFPQNTINLDNKNYFFDNENDNDFDQYKYDYLESLIISRSGINNWSISYKDQISFFENIDDVTERIRFLFENLSIDYLSDFVLDNSERKLMMTVTKVSSAEHLDNLLDALDKMISIKEYSIKSFQQNEISFSLTIFGTEDQFKKSVQTHKDFSIESTATEIIKASLNSI
ncbi:MAG: hypothetical protein CM15mP11_01880 [Gammaproteobacteria bacterium]|nr:MAG: hypothetical protein CM15mP11_01880 [Gammaproteobacteria bacterium]